MPVITTRRADATSVSLHRSVYLPEQPQELAPVHLRQLLEVASQHGVVLRDDLVVDLTPLVGQE
jgi:hypothetical protein